MLGTYKNRKNIENYNKLKSFLTKKKLKYLCINIFRNCITCLTCTYLHLKITFGYFVVEYFDCILEECKCVKLNCCRNQNSFQSTLLYYIGRVGM